MTNEIDENVDHLRDFMEQLFSHYDDYLDCREKDILLLELYLSLYTSENDKIKVIVDEYLPIQYLINVKSKIDMKKMVRCIAYNLKPDLEYNIILFLSKSIDCIYQSFMIDNEINSDELKKWLFSLYELEGNDIHDLESEFLNTILNIINLTLPEDTDLDLNTAIKIVTDNQIFMSRILLNSS